MGESGAAGVGIGVAAGEGEAIGDTTVGVVTGERGDGFVEPTELVRRKGEVVNTAKPNTPNTKANAPAREIKTRRWSGVKRGSLTRAPPVETQSGR
jgi:hypothetical protein